MNYDQDAQLRALALEAALKTPNPQQAVTTPQGIVEAARLYHKFLTGDNK